MQGLDIPSEKHMQNWVQGSVQIKTATWNRESHGLFDYECKSLYQRRFTFENSGRIVRNEKTSELIEATEQSSASPDHIILAQITREDTAKNTSDSNTKPRYWLKAGDISKDMCIEDMKQHPYLIVRSLKVAPSNQQRGYKLIIGDVIRFGKVEYLVTELKTKQQTLSAWKKQCAELKICEVPNDLMGSCKICTDEVQQPEGNFFISPCNCKGSCSVVHIYCLKRWIESKLVARYKEHEGVASYNFMKYECEICKDAFPKIVRKDGVDHELFVLKRPQGPYVVLEALKSEQRENKDIHVIEATKPNEMIKIGRGHSCEIRVNDLSVSRQHASIKFQKGNFLLFDNASKFGTLIRMRRDVPIPPRKLAFQFGRTVMTIKHLVVFEPVENVPRSLTPQ